MPAEQSFYLTLPDRPGFHLSALTFIDGGVIEYVGGGWIQAVVDESGTLTLPARSLALTLEEKP
jgi:hypothetical protein